MKLRQISIAIAWVCGILAVPLDAGACGESRKSHDCCKKMSALKPWL